MTPVAKEQIVGFGRSLAEPVRIGLHPAQGEHGEAFRRFCEALSRLAPRVMVEELGAYGKKGPALEVSPRLVYRALPVEGELAPFLRLVAAANGGAPTRLPSSLDALVETIRVPATLDIFIASQCPFCPAVVEQVASLALVSEWISVRVVDALIFSDEAGRHHTSARRPRWFWRMVCAGREVWNSPTSCA